MAQDVTVTSAGGGLSLTGRVIGFDGEFLQIETQYGPLTVNYAETTCVGATCPDPAHFVPVIRFSGAAQMANVLVPALVDAFANAQGWATTTSAIDDTDFTLTVTTTAGEIMAQFAFRGSTADEGFADLIAHEADIVMANREVRPDEVSRAAAIGLGHLDDPAQSRIVGLDALTPVTSPGEGATHISLRQLANAFRGRVTNWSQIGGADLPISLHLGPESHGQTQGFIDHVVGMDGGTIASSVIYHENNDVLAEVVAATPGALGILPFGETALTQPLALRDACGLVATPVLTALKTEDYPLTAPLFLYLPNRRLAPVARDFLAFTRSPQAQLVVRRAGFVDQGAVPISLDAQGQRFANAIASAGVEVPLEELQRMVKVLSERTRMSTSFRFEVGSTRLDAQSRSNLYNLAQAIRDGQFRDQTLTLVGFSDGRGGAAPNRDLSAARAEAVLRDLIALLGTVPDDITLETAAFGEALPMGCDDTEWGRQMNRRVELWVTQ